jgi:hypothetical protein
MRVGVADALVVLMRCALGDPRAASRRERPHDTDANHHYEQRDEDPQQPPTAGVVCAGGKHGKGNVHGRAATRNLPPQISCAAGGSAP